MHPSWMQMMRLFVPLHLADLVINVANWGGRNTAYRLHLDEPKDLQIGGGISETPLKCRELRLAAIHLRPLEGGPNRRPFGQLATLAISGHCGWQRRKRENRKTGRQEGF